ncbi:MAG: NTP transferase domain-containing protein [Halobacteriales archaeon]
MDAVVLAGGRGSRFEPSVEKPLYRVAGERMVDRVLAALADSRAGRVHAAISPQAPATRDHLSTHDVDLVSTPGAGYVADLEVALDAIGRPALTVAADLPLLDGDAVDAVLAARDGGSLTAAVPVALKRALDVSADTTLPGGRLAPAGVNVVGDGDDRQWVTWDARLAVNVNRAGDAAVAERLAGALDP